MLALEPDDAPNWAPVDGGVQQRFCANADSDACNWLVPAGSPDRLCLACRHNRTIPNLANPGDIAAWRALELAKHRLFYSLLRWRLPLRTRAEDADHGLVFDFLADPLDGLTPKVMTGHDDGRITIALSEANPAEIERRRAEFDEPYRTVLGHFRHEVGHHYWDVMVRDAGSSRRSAPSSATSGRTMPRRSSATTGTARWPTGAPISSRPMRRPIPGRISPRRGLTISISSIRSTPPPPSGSGSRRRSTARARTRRGSISTPMSRAASTRSSTPGRRSRWR